MNHAAQLAIINKISRQESRGSPGYYQAAEQYSHFHDHALDLVIIS